MQAKALQSEQKIARWIVAAALVGAFLALFGQTMAVSASAYITRLTAPCGFGFGWGWNGSTYGYGYGYGAECGGGGGGGEVSPSVQVALPNGGESLTGGGTYNIVWSFGGTHVTGTRLSYSTDGGSTWTQIVASNNDGHYSWSVPYVNTTTARIKAEALAEGEVAATDTSDANFTIVSAAPPSGSGGGSGSSGEHADTHSDEHAGGVTSHGSEDREHANGHLPSGYMVDWLVKMSDDGNPATESDSTVYYIGMDAKRHPFPSRPIFDTWYADFGDVHHIDAATLASIPLGAPIMSRPGTRFVKISSDPKTYYVAPGNKLRWIKTEAAAAMLSGADWNHNVIDIDPTLFVLFSAGDDIDVAYLAADWPAGAVVKSPDFSGDTFYITSNGRRNFASETALHANHFQNKFTMMTPTNAGWTTKSTTTNIVGLEDELFSLMH